MTTKPVELESTAGREPNGRVGGTRTLAATSLAWSVWAVCAALVALAAFLYYLTPPVSPPPEYFLSVVRRGWIPERVVWLGVLWLSYPTVGAIIASRRPRNVIGWIFCLAGLIVALTVFARAYTDYSVIAYPGTLPATLYTAWFSDQSGIALVAILLTTALLLLLFPDGRPPSRPWWVVAWMAAPGSVLLFLVPGTWPGPIDPYPSFDNPFGVGGTAHEIVKGLGSLGATLVLVGGLFAGLSLLPRWRLADEEERRQLKWFVYSAGPVLIVSWVWLWEGGVLVAPALLPVVVGFAIFKHRLYNIDRIINRTLVYGLLTAIVVGIYALIVGGLGELVQTRSDLGIALLAIGLVAIIFQPLRRRLQSATDRLIPLSRPIAQDLPISRDPVRMILLGIGPRGAARLAWAAWALSTSVVVCGGLLNFLSASAPYRSDWILTILYILLFLAYPTVGALIASRRPENPIGWIFCAVGLVFGAGLFASGYVDYALHASSRLLPGVQYAAWFSMWASFPATLLGATMLFLLFPDGRLPAPLILWRPVAWTAVVGSVMVALGTALGSDSDYNGIANPFQLEGAVGNFLEMLGAFGGTFLALSCFASMASPFLRLRRASGRERQQLKWFVYATALAATSFLVISMWPESAEGSLTWKLGEVFWNLAVVSFLVFPITTAIAILKHRLYEIDRIINRTLVYGALTATVVGAYALVVGVLSTLLQTDAGEGLLIPVLATGLIAVLFTPVRNRLQRSVNRMMYGDRDDPYMVLSRLGKSLEPTLAPGAVLQGIVETVAQTLKLPYAAISLKQGGDFTTAARYGTPSDESIILPLHYGTETVGRFVLAPRAPGEPFTSSDLRLLEDLARQVGVAAYAVRLTADLQRSRERLVVTREEERRRLRRDLHDGLGPQLATFTLKLDAARNLLDSEPEAAGSLLLELKAQTQETISGIRRLAYELRPPALDELGLVSALREQAADYGSAFSVEAPEELAPLPAAVEVAAYRVALEAMTNTARHARARVCRVRIIPSDDELEIEVFDDGVGLPEDHRIGIGISSMRERAAEIGGTCTVEAVPTGGTRVEAKLPTKTPGFGSHGSSKDKEQWVQV